jgi:hypothetical protein
MLPIELSYLAQERCKELRGEIREPSTSFFQGSFRRMLSSFFSSSAKKPVSNTKTQMARGSKLTES